MTNSQLSFHINKVKDPFCIDENYAVTGHTSKRDCENASTGNEWFPKECNKIKYKKTDLIGSQIIYKYRGIHG